MTQSMQPRKPKPLVTLSSGDMVFKYRNIIAKPHAVLLDEKCNTLFVVESGSQSHPLSMVDTLNARLAAHVVAQVEKSRFRRKRKIRLFVAVEDHTQIEISPQLDETRRLIDQWQAHRRHEHLDFQWIPASALALVLTQNACLLHPPIKGA